MAFYFTRAFGEERWAIHWYAPARGHELVRRRDLLPDEPNHPRADQEYYKLQLGPLERLAAHHQPALAARDLYRDDVGPLSGGARDQRVVM